MAMPFVNPPVLVIAHTAKMHVIFPETAEVVGEFEYPNHQPKGEVKKVIKGLKVRVGGREYQCSRIVRTAYGTTLFNVEILA